MYGALATVQKDDDETYMYYYIYTAHISSCWNSDKMHTNLGIYKIISKICLVGAPFRT